MLLVSLPFTIASDELTVSVGNDLRAHWRHPKLRRRPPHSTVLGVRSLPSPRYRAYEQNGRSRVLAGRAVHPEVSCLTRLFRPLRAPLIQLASGISVMRSRCDTRCFTVET